VHKEVNSTFNVKLFPSAV